MPRFAILEHDHPALHWDFLLENGDVLLTWRLSAPPAPGATVEAARAFDHRLLYLDYEGPVSGGRGAVTRWDGGMFKWVERQPIQLTVHLQGARLQGVFHLKWLEGESWRGWFTADPAGAADGSAV
jgi:DNA polymerase Ligase (LigD)